MADVLMYSTRNCSYCRLAEALFTRRGVALRKILVDEDAAQRAEMTARTHRTAVPQIFIGATHVGGYADLVELERSGELDRLLTQP